MVAAEHTLEEQAEELTIEIGLWNREIAENLIRAKAQQDWSLVDNVIDAALKAEHEYIAAQLFDV